MKFCLSSVLAFLFPAVLHAESIFLKDGKIHSAKELRRDGSFLFYKSATPEGSQTDTVTPLNQVDRVDFGDIQALEEARQLSKQGDALGVLEKTSGPAAFFRSYADVPGNQWPEVMRMRLPALAVAGSEKQIIDLQTQWTPTGDQDLDTAYRLILASKNDPSGARTAWKALAQPGSTSLSAGISWLGIGNEALIAKDWSAAIRAFLSIEVFVTQQKLLQPKALLGAAKAYAQKGESSKAAPLIEELKTEYPSSANEAATILK